MHNNIQLPDPIYFILQTQKNDFFIRIVQNKSYQVISYLANFTWILDIIELQVAATQTSTINTEE